MKAGLYAFRRVAAFFFILAAATACRSAAEEVGTITGLKDSVTIRREGAAVTAQLNGSVSVGDVIETGTGAMVKIVFADGVLLTVGGDSRVKVDRWLFDTEKRRRDDLLLLFNGIARIILETFSQDSRFEIRGSNAVAGVKGTDFAMRTSKSVNITRVYVFEGVVRTRNLFRPPGEFVAVGANQWTEVIGRTPPRPPRPIGMEILRELRRQTTIADQVRGESMKEVVRSVLEKGVSRSAVPRTHGKEPPALARAWPSNTQVRVVGADLTLPPGSVLPPARIQAGSGTAPSVSGGSVSGKGSPQASGIPGVSAHSGSVPLGQGGGGSGLGSILGQ